jgi:PIN domain nuclease of toxin-antitoxin system
MGRAVRVLLDTHAFIWSTLDSPRLPASARRAISTAAEVLISAASAWEIATKHRLGKLPGFDRHAGDIAEAALQSGFTLLPISFAHASLSGSLKIDHADPFDRMLIAQALLDDLALVSNEQRFDAFGVRRLW